jgi:hypothetical protein
LSCASREASAFFTDGVVGIFKIVHLARGEARESRASPAQR